MASVSKVVGQIKTGGKGRGLAFENDSFLIEQDMHKFIIAILLVCLTSTLGAADLRKWTNHEGETIVASIIGVLEDRVYLQTRTGKRFRYPVSALSASDQAVVKVWTPEIKEQPARTAGISLSESRIAQLLQGKLVMPDRQKESFIQAPLDAARTPKYYAFYYSAHWCPPCRQFTPKLVQFYNRMKAAGADFEVIFVSADRSPQKMYQYMKEDGMRWPAVDFQKGKSSPDIMKYSGSGIPCLVFIDHEGKVLSDSYRNGNYVGPYRVLDDMEKTLKRELARSI